MFQQIFVMWDGSELAERAFAIASDMAAIYDAEMTAVCVVERPRAQHGSVLLTAPRVDHPREDPSRANRPRAGHAPASADQAQALFAEKHADIDAAASPCQLEIVYGHDVVADLLKLAHEHAADLIVVGHQSHPSALLPHGLTERLMLSVDIPLLVVGGQLPL